MDFPKKQAQRLMPLYLLEYSEKLFENHPDPEAPWGGGGSDYTAGYGIDITNSEISVDTEVIATKSDISNMVTTTQLEDALDDYALKTDIPENVSDLNNDAGYTTQTWVENQNYIKNNDQTYAPIFRGQGVYVGISSGYPYTWYAQDRIVKYPGFYGNVYEYAFPAKSGTFAMTSDIPENVSDLNNDAGYITNSDLSSALSTVYQPNVELSSMGYKVNPYYSGIAYEYGDKRAGIVVEDLSAMGEPTIAVENHSKARMVPGKVYTLDEFQSSGIELTLSHVKIIDEPNHNFTTLSQGKLMYEDWNGVRNFNLNSTRSSGDYTLAVLDDIPSLSGYATESWVNNQGYITGINSSDVIAALGYTPGTSNFSGNYNDLTNKPDLSIYAESSDLATVATSGSYNDLSNKPTIPTVNDPTITFTQGGVTKGSITLNQSSNQTIALDASGSSYSAGTGIDITNNEISIDNTVALKSELFSGNYNDLTNKPTIPTATSDLTNDSGFITSSDLPTNHVTTNTDQTITGIKTFSGSSNLGNGIIIKNTGHYGNGIMFTDNADNNIGFFEFRTDDKVLKFGVNTNLGPGYKVGFQSFGTRTYTAYLPNNADKYASIGTGDVYLPLSVNGKKASVGGNIRLSATSTVTPTTTQLVFTYTDDTTETITLMTGASVTTTLS